VEADVPDTAFAYMPAPRMHKDMENVDYRISSHTFKTFDGRIELGVSANHHQNAAHASPGNENFQDRVPSE